MVMPVDQGAILRSGAALIPDLQAQLAQQQQMDLQRQEMGLRSQVFQAKQAEDQREVATANAYAADITAIGRLPQDQQPQAIIALMQKYPKQSEALKRSWDAQDDAVKGANFREASELYSLVQNGVPEKAAARLRQRIEADRVAGQETDDDEAIAIELESGDPARIRRAASQIGWQLSTAAGPDKFASTFGVLNPKTTLQQEYDWLIGQGRTEEAENLLANKVDPVIPVVTQDGTTGYLASDFRGANSPSRPQRAPNSGNAQGDGNEGGGDNRGGAQPVADAKSIARGLFDNIAITQNRRDPSSALGKANPNSWHNRSGAAIDVKPIPGMKFTDYVKRYRDAGYTILESRNEVGKGRSAHATGDHWHIVLGEKGGEATASPPRVTSRAQFDKLASGTVFIDPKGATRRKP